MPCGPWPPPCCWAPVRRPHRRPPRRRSSSCTATATAPRCGRPRCGASSPTAGRATGCTPSTCPTRWRATRTTCRSPAARSTTEHAQFLAAEVDKVLARTGASQVVLVGNSRGGNAIRNYVQNFGGASKVSMAVLGGTPNHGVWALKDFRPNSEFNGVGPFLVALNAPKGAERRRGHARRALADDPLRQQRQVRPARRGVDRRQGQADERQLRRPGAQGREERGAAAA